MKRRHFLKIAAFSSLAGIGGLRATDVIFAPGELEASTLNAASGTRYAMVIDITKLSPGDYEKCTRACHETHNVPDVGNLKEEIKWIWTETYEHAFPGAENPHLNDGYKERPFLVLCNHCEHPPCVRVCPTRATFRRGDGIIMMDYHRCIGCRFCMAACPFGARSFNWRDPRPYLTRTNPEFPTRTKGVVEKCNFCAERLARDLKPACVEATKGSGAMIFGDLNDPHGGVREALRKNYSIRRKPGLGTSPSVYYIIGGAGDAG